MDKSLKQRLIGASVLIALAIIFIPMFFDGSGQEERAAKRDLALPEPEFKFEEQLPRMQDLNSGTLPPSLSPPEASHESSAPRSESVPLPQTSKPVRTPSERPVEIVPPQVSEPPVARAQKPNTQTATDLRTRQKSPAKVARLGWVVQVGSFRQRANAINLRNRLRHLGYTVFENKIGSFYRVHVGPESKRDQAQVVQAKLFAQQKLKGIVVQLR